jgi:transcription termination factor Rho
MELPGEVAERERSGGASSGVQDSEEGGGRRDWRRPENRRGRSRRGGRRRQRAEERAAGSEAGGNGVVAEETDAQGDSAQASAEAGAGTREGRLGRRRRRGRRGQRGGSSVQAERNGSAQATASPAPAPTETIEGLFLLDKGGNGVLRRAENQYLPGKQDVWVPQRLVQRHKLRDGALVTGPVVRGQGQYRLALAEVDQVDGREPRELANLTGFKHLTSIDPDFHYAVGDVTGDVSMRVLDVICPVGRGTRGLIVAPPRSGKTILMRKFAAAIEQGYPDVKLMVLLVDERPEEATEWRRSTGGQVFVSTNDETARNHVHLAEVVWKRCQRLVELGEDVVLLLDSITRLARAYNNLEGGSGRTLSGGLDSRAMERPRSFFGSARNTETAGSLTILGTTLVETGSRLDQLVFEEFKGTGNSECVLSRKLADRRIFPAIDVERSGTRKEEKLYSSRRLKQITTLRRVLIKMNFIEAMELLITKLEDVDRTDDFLKRFEVDPEA